MRLYYSPGACSLAAHIALEDAGTPFEVERVSTAEGAHRRPEYLAINPKGRVPALVDGDFILTELVAILCYIAHAAPSADLIPLPGSRDHARALEWLSWLSNTVHPAYAQIRRPERYVADERDYPPVIEKGRTNLRDNFRMIEEKLRDRTFALGERYSVVDPFLLVLYNWGCGKFAGLNMRNDFPAWTMHFERMKIRPAVQRAVAREGITLA
ncbi:MAG TPA: glutathione S-transferase N-terminal domain-containing protein [Alphaproteobacteria bacterium]